MKMGIGRKFLSACVFAAMVLFCRGAVFSDVGVNIVIANPSDDEAREVSVNYELPPGLAREDVLDTGELRVEYDVNRSVFYVKGELFLNPKETRTVKVVIRDIWNIPQEKFNTASEILSAKVRSLTGDADADTLEFVSGELRSRLEEVRKYQQDHAGDIQKRMEMYTSNLEKIRRIENDIFSLEDLVKRGTDEERSDETVVLTIEARNPSEEERTLPVRYDLPREIIPQHVEETGGMEIRHDVAKNIFYLYTESSFAPRETKRFQIRLENVWTIPGSEIQMYVDEAVELREWFAGTPEEKTADMLLGLIQDNADRIITSQDSAESVRDRVAAFRANEKRLRDIKDALERMRILKARSMQEDRERADRTDATAESVRQLMEEEIFQVLRELSARLFREKLTASTIWRILMLVVGFAMVLTAVFYAVWTIKVKKDEARTYDKVE